jgi:hypothetical protein
MLTQTITPMSNPPIQDTIVDTTYDIIEDIHKLFHEFDNQFTEFMDKLKKPKTELKVETVMEDGNEKIKFIVQPLKPDDKNYERAGNCLNTYNIWDCYAHSIVCIIKLLKKDLSRHKEMLIHLSNNKEKLRMTLGEEVFINDTICFKDDILETRSTFEQILNDYIWEF